MYGDVWMLKYSITFKWNAVAEGIIELLAFSGCKDTWAIGLTGYNLTDWTLIWVSACNTVHFIISIHVIYVCSMKGG